MNQNHPERHRLIVRDRAGTIIDQKPYRANWRLARDALGVQLTANILFSPAVLLVEGYSDPLYLYELFRKFNRTADIDAEANMLGVFSYGESLPNLRFLLQRFRHDNLHAKVAVLCDGDKSGKKTYKAIKALCEAHSVSSIILADAAVIEDYALDRGCLLKAACETIRTAAQSLSIALPSDVEQQVEQAFDTKDNRNSAERFKKICEHLLHDEASKVGLARNYVFNCREKLGVAMDSARKEASARALQDYYRKVRTSGYESETGRRG